MQQSIQSANKFAPCLAADPQRLYGGLIDEID